MIDDWMPQYDFVERHHAIVRVPSPVVFEAISDVDLSAHPLIRLLLALRALPARLVRQSSKVPHGPGLTLRDAAAYGFVLLAEEPDREIVLGLTGRFWHPGGNILATAPATFRDRIPAGAARVAWSFTLADTPAGTRLSTETRILCADAAARRAFGRYWFLVRPGSGLIRRAMLRMIKREAEHRFKHGVGRCDANQS
jgi:hypothetical protein